MFLRETRCAGVNDDFTPLSALWNFLGGSFLRIGDFLCSYIHLSYCVLLLLLSFKKKIYSVMFAFLHVFLSSIIDLSM